MGAKHYPLGPSKISEIKTLSEEHEWIKRVFIRKFNSNERPGLKQKVFLLVAC